MSLPRRLALSLFPLAALFLSACQPEQAQRAGYFGPTDSLDTIVARIDANNAQIPSLWARQNFDGSIVDDQHAAHAVNADGVILYRAPHELLITAHNEFGPAFEMGVTDDLYWLKVVQGMDTMWWGRMKNVGKPCVTAMPIRPDLILDVLAVGALDTNFNREPYPIMRFNNDVDAYMVDSIIHSSDRMLAQKEVWYDRQTLLPELVLLFDNNGRVVLQARLSQFQPLAVPGISPDRAPKAATIYKLWFRETGSTMQFTLSDQAISHNGIPRPGGIHMPDPDSAGVKNVIQIDKDCDTDTTAPSPRAAPPE